MHQSTGLYIDLSGDSEVTELEETIASKSTPGMPALAITTIDAERVNATHVRLSGAIRGAPDDADALLLCDLRNETIISPEGEKRAVITARNVTPAEFRVMARAEAKRTGASHAILYVHGFMSEPEFALSTSEKASAKLARRGAFVVPVLWPCTDDVLVAYLRDRRKVIPGAANALRNLFVNGALRQCFGTALDADDGVDSSPKSLPVSLLAHSMGSYVVRLVAPQLLEEKTSSSTKNETQQEDLTAALTKSQQKKSFFEKFFQHVFLVAADVDASLFDADSTDDAGAALVAATQKRVHVLYTARDLALVVRLFLTGFVPALGKRGYEYAKIRPAFRGALTKIDVSDFDLSGFSLTNRILFHNYHFSPDAIDYYASQLFPPAAGATLAGDANDLDDLDDDHVVDASALRTATAATSDAAASDAVLGGSAGGPGLGDDAPPPTL